LNYSTGRKGGSCWSWLSNAQAQDFANILFQVMLGNHTVIVSLYLVGIYRVYLLVLLTEGVAVSRTSFSSMKDFHCHGKVTYKHNI
jgi:hypothetical protein